MYPARYRARFVLGQTSLLLAALAMAPRASAQAPLAAAPAVDGAAPPRVSFGVGGGFADGPPFGRGPGDIGYAALATAELRTPLRALRLRGEGLFANWGSNRRVSALTASALALPPVRWPALPYLLGGGGAYTMGDDAGLSPGWTLGAGLRIPAGRRAFFVESRLHAINVGQRGLDRSGLPAYARLYRRWQHTYTPLTFGLQF